MPPTTSLPPTPSVTTTTTDQSSDEASGSGSGALGALPPETAVAIAPGLESNERSASADIADALAPLADECLAGDFVACEDLLGRSTPGSPEEEIAQTCGRRTDSAASCASTFCPERAFADPTEIPRGARIVEAFDTESFTVLICVSSGQLYYFATAKAPPNASITLEATVDERGTYVAENPSASGTDDFSYEIGPGGLLVTRAGEVILSQPLSAGS